MSLMMSLFGTLSGSGPSYTVTVTGRTISSVDSGVQTVGLRFNADGTVDEYESAGAASWQQIESSTDWIIPNSFNTEGFHVKLTVQSGDSPDAGTVLGSSDAINTWLTLGNGTTREWFLENEDPQPSQSGVWRVEISADGGTTTLDSGDFTMTANDLGL